MPAKKRDQNGASQLRNVDVEAVKEHSNAFGKSFSKKSGDVYTHPDPTADIAAGFVKQAGEKSTKQKESGESAQS